MTTFKIPEGKVVDRIELDAGEGKATINIIYKEEKPKYYVPRTKEEAVEFVVLPTEALDEINELCDTLRASSGHGEVVMAVRRHWQILHTLLSERK